MATVKSKNKKIWKFLFLQSSPELKPQPHFKLLELETWQPNALKVPIFAIFKGELQKYTSFLWLGTNEKCLFGLSSTLTCEICRGVFSFGKMGSI
jgi:hypothetical protein